MSRHRTEACEQADKLEGAHTDILSQFFYHHWAKPVSLTQNLKAT